jgi:hypothetical protein
LKRLDIMCPSSRKFPYFRIADGKELKTASVDVLTEFLSHSIGLRYFEMICIEGRLQISWTHLVTPSRNFVEVR